MEKKDFPRVKGVVKKWTKNGQRYLLHDKDLSGKDIYVTIPIEDADTEKEYFEKIRNARMKLIEKKNHTRIEDFIDEYVEKKQLADSTQKIFRSTLKPFSLDNQHNARMIKELLFSGKYKQSTIKTKFGYVRSFFRWLILLKKVDNIVDPTQDFCVKSPTVFRTRTLTEIEELNLLDRIKRIDLDMQLIIRLALYTGARISSICALTKDSLVDGKIYYLNVKCKKAYDYPIPIKNTETIRLFEIISSMSDNKLFTKHSVQAYTSMIDRFLFKLFGRNQNGETISIHSLRHSFATKALRAGVQPEIIARLLDHSSPAITLKVYARHSDQQIEDAVNKIFE